MKNLIACIASLLLVSCGATVNYDYDKQTDFLHYKSYNYFPTIESGLSELDNQRIIKAADSILQQSGFVKTENPQFYINFFSKEFVSNSRNTIGVGVGSSGRNTGIGVSGGIPIGGRTVSQKLTIDFIDAIKDALFWQAVVESEFKERTSPSKKQQHYYNALQKAFKNYPPK
ncbi:MAG: DUF4136 domain-containing protein [Bacteroidetes bacterium HGW-Bacteroidetes-2]|jgi:hypothetical protein|nr:MAG: DUF4136 domain-containing protein [Bacteroidetes bacterium HGW-Bacteroidetes-2]